MSIDGAMPASVYIVRDDLLAEIKELEAAKQKIDTDIEILLNELKLVTAKINVMREVVFRLDAICDGKGQTP